MYQFFNLLFLAVPREHWLIYNRNILKARLNLQRRKSDPPFVIRLYARLTLDELVFTHGFTTLSTALLIFNMSENISKQQGQIRVQFFHGGRE